MLLVILFAIKLLSQVNIFKHKEMKHGREILINVRKLEPLERKWCKINKDIKFIKPWKKEHETSNKIRKCQNSAETSPNYNGNCDAVKTSQKKKNKKRNS